MKEVVEGDSSRAICVQLQGKERVRHCQKYQTNTNKCVKCVKRFKEDVVEYVLNEKYNLCEDVLPLMCRKIET